MGVDGWTSKNYSAAYQIAEVYALRGDGNATFLWLDRAWSNRDPGMNYLLYDHFLLRFKAYVGYDRAEVLRCDHGSFGIEREPSGVGVLSGPKVNGHRDSLAWTPAASVA